MLLGRAILREQHPCGACPKPPAQTRTRRRGLSGAEPLVERQSILVDRVNDTTLHRRAWHAHEGVIEKGCADLGLGSLAERGGRGDDLYAP